MSAEWGTLVTLGALAPYGPAFKPICLGWALKIRQKKKQVLQ